MNLPFFIAKRYLVSRKSHNAINIISGISVLGICIGTMALVIVLSAFNGLSGLVQSLYNSFDPDLEITVKQGKTFDPQAPEIKALRQLSGVAYYTEVVEGNALLKFNDKQCITTVKGVSTAFERMSGFDSLVHEGRFDISGNHIVVGKGISYVLQTGPNDQFTPISMYAPKRGELNTLNPEDALNELKVYQSGAFSINDEFDGKYTIMNIDKARELLDYKTEVTKIELGLGKAADVAETEARVTKDMRPHGQGNGTDEAVFRLADHGSLHRMGAALLRPGPPPGKRGHTARIGCPASAAGATRRPTEEFFHGLRRHQPAR